MSTKTTMENALRYVSKEIEEHYDKKAINYGWCMIVCEDAARQFEYLQARLAESQRREQAAVKELDILHERLGGELPKRCESCELWGKAGWSQHDIGYCEGDDHPHKGTDFCNRWRGPVEGINNE